MPGSGRRRHLTSAAVAVWLLLAGCGDVQPDAAAPRGTQAVALTERPPARTPGRVRAQNRRGPGRTAPASPTPRPAPSPAPLALPASTPVAVSIPAIDVRSSLIKLGLNADNTMEVPRDWGQAGWFKHSPTPGEVGPAIVAGHVDSDTGPAVFYRLRDLEPRDTIEITRDDGTTAVFRVTKTEQYPKDDFPTEKVYGNLDHAGLRLITCGGDFDLRSDHYRENLVVYAELVKPKGG